MIKESKYCTDIIKGHFNKDFVMSKEDDEDFEKTILNFGFLIMLMFKVVSKQEIIIISLENIEVLCIEIVISNLNQLIKFVLYSTT